MFLWKKIVAPRSKDKDRSRREFILNLLLAGLILLSSLAFFINLFHSLFVHRKVGESPLTTGIISLFLIILFVLSKKGKSYIVALIFNILLILVGVYGSIQWGADLPVNLLIFALVIVMGGILIDTKFAIVTAIVCGIAIVVSSQLEIQGIIHPNRIRAFETIHLTDSIVNVVILSIIALVSWLFNRESERALRRARMSERVLQKERDQLEAIVEKRTEMLKQAQAEKIIQLYRFAEFGRMASGLFHDLVNPLTLVSLNLTKLAQSKTKVREVSDAKVALTRALEGTDKLQKFIAAAKKQFKYSHLSQHFSLNKEIGEVIDILKHKSDEKQVEVIVSVASDIKTFGNPFKFNQLITNLLSNAIDSYDEVKTNKKIVTLTTINKDNVVTITVRDEGSGISKKNLPRIFEPLFTTKSNDVGTGIGLSISKDIVENDFKGKIDVMSGLNKGTIFTISFPIRTHK